jgi:hypothetical protein
MDLFSHCLFLQNSLPEVKRSGKGENRIKNWPDSDITDRIPVGFLAQAFQ